MCSDVHKNFTLKFRDIFVNTMQTVTATVTAAADEHYINFCIRDAASAPKTGFLYCVLQRGPRAHQLIVVEHSGRWRNSPQPSGQLKEITTHTHWSLEVNPLYSQPISEQSKKARFFLTVCTSASTENFKIENIQCNGWKSRNRALLKNKEKRHMFLF